MFDFTDSTKPNANGVRSLLNPTLAVDILGTLLAIAILCGSELSSFAEITQPADLTNWQQRIEQDWIIQEQLRYESPSSTPISTQADAAGGCDGVIDGTWGFHTGSAKEPWWQVDLGQVYPLDRVVIWNRCQASERAAQFQLRCSVDGQDWQTVYQHDGQVFYGFTDKTPLTLQLTNHCVARFVRVQLPGAQYLHLEEVEVYGRAAAHKNLALHQPANQASVSPWSRNHHQSTEPDWHERTLASLQICDRLLSELEASTAQDDQARIAQLRQQLSGRADNTSIQSLFIKARGLQRELALQNPMLDFPALLFTKSAPPSFNHMSDQYYGWWSLPGGGIYLLKNINGKCPAEECLTDSFKHKGRFLRPTLSYEGRKVLFAWCRYYPELSAQPNKLDKGNVPEDAFYHLFEMDLDGSNVRQLTRGKYDDFDARYLPDGRIVFLSTRRGQAIQVGRASAAQTLTSFDQPDCYVRCGGGPERPVAVYTLHTMNADGSDLNAISPFEMFEWTPEIGQDGSILYSRWDYIDRDNMPYMGLWAIHPDGSNARLIYGNYTQAPHCTFEPKPIPGSRKIIFTASAHHAQTMGSLVLLDPSIATEGPSPLTRLTPEVPFPEIEAWPKSSYANPWPLSERFYLVAWGCEGAQVPGPAGWDRWHAVKRPPNGLALYWFDAETGSKELLYADSDFACTDPIPVRPRLQPPLLADRAEHQVAQEGRFLLTDVYQGLKTVNRGDIKSLRIVAVPPKTHPTMNFPNLGITRDDPGKCVLGTVPVENDGSAHFRAPSGVIVFFQALNAEGLAVQTMRSATHVQPGQTLSCIGCHEHRQQAPASKNVLAARREPSKITVGPKGSWTMRFDQLIQPVLDGQCVSCHHPKGEDLQAARYDLTPAKAYDSLVNYGKPSLQDQVWAGYRRGYSVEGENIAQRSALWALLSQPDGHAGVKLGRESRERFAVWMDTYAQRSGVFSAEQEQRLIHLRKANAELLNERHEMETVQLDR